MLATMVLPRTRVGELRALCRPFGWSTGGLWKCEAPWLSCCGGVIPLEMEFL